jgi:hypothetical protein
VFNDLCHEPDCQGPISDPAEVYSAEDLPQAAPINVRSLPFNSTALNVTWAPVPDNRDKVRGKLTGYRIKYWNQVTCFLLLLFFGFSFFPFLFLFLSYSFLSCFLLQVSFDICTYQDIDLGCARSPEV